MLYFSTAPDDETIADPHIRPLWEDMVQCEKLIAVDDSQFARRTFCRAAYAFMEGQLGFLRETAAQLAVGHQANGGQINIPLVSALHDEVVRIERNGRIRVEPARTPFINSVALVFRSIAEPLQLDPEEFFGVNEWANFQQAVKTRHRITHPKSEKDLTITHPDMIEIRHALWWFFEAMRKIAVASIQNQAEQAGAGQPATRAVVEPEGGDKPQTEAEGRSR